MKLGLSKKPERRVHQLQTGHSERLRLYHAEPVSPEKVRSFEKLLHRDLNYLRMIGEWFDLSVADAMAHIQFTIIQYDGIDNLAEKMRQHRV